MAGLASRAVLPDDAELLRSAADGDWQSIATLYDRHRDGALAVAMSVLGDASEAEDVVHDAFVDLPRMARSFDPQRGRLIHWLYRSVRNRAIDHVRRRARWLSRMAPSSSDGQEGVLAMTPERGISPVDQAEARELVDLVARLDARHAHVIRLAFVDGWSHSEVARLTGLPLGTVKTRIRNGLRQLRGLMAEPDTEVVGGKAARPIRKGIVMVCSADPKLARAVSTHSRGLARVVPFEDRGAIGAAEPTGVVVDLRTATAKSALQLVADAGWQALPIVVVRGATNRERVRWPGARVVEVEDGGEVPRVDLRLAVTALLSAARDGPLREAAIDRLLRSDGLAILVGDRLGRVRGATAGAALLFGRTPRQLIGAFVTELSAMPRETTERQWQVLASTGQWSGRTSVRRPTGDPLRLVGRAWMPAGAGFVGVYAPDVVRSVRRGDRLSRGASPSRPRTPPRSARPTASAAPAGRAGR